MTVGQLKRIFKHLNDDVELFLVTKHDDGCHVEDMIYLAGTNADVSEFKDIKGLYFYGDSLEADLGR